MYQSAHGTAELAQAGQPDNSLSAVEIRRDILQRFHFATLHTNDAFVLFVHDASTTRATLQMRIIREGCKVPIDFVCRTQSQHILKLICKRRGQAY